MRKNILFLFLMTLCFFRCQQQSQPPPSTAKNEYNIIPIPPTMTPLKGQFVLDENTVLVNEGGEKIQPVAQYLLQKIEQSTGYKLKLKNEAVKKNCIIFQLDEQTSNDEAYMLSVSSARILIKAQTSKALFYGVQTLRQLLPPNFESSQVVENQVWNVPLVEIVDAPRFGYRGMHLDVSRHFFEVEAVKRFIDQMAYHKLNYFHWHLTDDQGWRIEIKKYPKLTEVGAYRNGTLIGHYNDQPHKFDGKRYGGFYTQAQIKEVVDYAAERFITVVPEIEMPGHAQAALAAYPELGCEGETFEVWQKWGVSDNVFCPTEETFAFLEGVLEEVIELFPSKYIHIGGDECPKTKWKESTFCRELMKKEGLKDEHELQSYFIQRMEKFINSKGKQIIGWDEILEGGLAPNATVMSWRGIEGGIEAAKSGHDVIMTPTSHCYFDYYQSDHPDEPLAIGGFLPLKKVYDYEPIPEELNEKEAKRVLGTQANLWTEYIPTVDKLEYMAFPRLSALAEVAWSNEASRDFDDFVSRLLPHIKRLEVMGIDAANHLYDLNSAIQPTGENVRVELSALAKDAAVHFTTDGSIPSSNSPQYDTPIDVNESTEIKAQCFWEGVKIGRAWQQSIEMHKAAGKKITLTSNPHPKYSGGGNGSIVNGVLGNNERYGDVEWLGFEGTDLEVVIDFGAEETFNEAVFRFFKGEGQWIYLPKSVELLVSENGTDFTSLAKKEDIEGDTKVVNMKVELDETTARFLKVVVQNYGVIPEDQQGGGSRSWMFVDEVRIY